MPDVPMKEFMDRVEGKLQGLSVSTLQAIIREWAKQTPSNRREEFLSNLDAPQDASIDAEGLLANIDDLMERAENGSFCKGWGWDPEIYEERDFGDETWAEEVAELFRQARETLDTRQYDCARDAYEKLFDILQLGEEPGHLPGADLEGLVETNLDEARALYLRAIYLASPDLERPGKMFEGFQRFHSFYNPKELNFTGVQNAGTVSLPAWDEFLPRWISLLEGKTDNLSEFLLREAIQLQGGREPSHAFRRRTGNATRGLLLTGSMHWNTRGITWKWLTPPGRGWRQFCPTSLFAPKLPSASRVQGNALVT